MNKDMLRYGAVMVVFICGLFGIELSEETATAIVIGAAIVVLIAVELLKDHGWTRVAVLVKAVRKALEEGVVTEETLWKVIEAPQTEASEGKHASND